MDQPLLKYPIYIVSKGRWKNPITAKCLISNNLPFKIAVEPEEYHKYCDSIGSEHVLQLPFSNLGLGSYPARNYCWEDSINNGFEKHFIFDDNIYCFDIFNKGMRTKCDALQALLSLQYLTERYKRVAISGYNYSMFVTKATRKPFTINTHVYSGMLINNKIPFRWRLKYNEDVDLCLQALHKKWSTILLNAYIIRKVSTTHKMKGGNQDELYKDNDHNKKMLKAKSLEKVWPQYAKTVFRFGRPHHQVSWTRHFPHPLIKNSNYNKIVERQKRELTSLGVK